MNIKHIEFALRFRAELEENTKTNDQLVLYVMEYIDRVERSQVEAPKPAYDSRGLEYAERVMSSGHYRLEDSVWDSTAPKIYAIKQVREDFGVRLTEAKALVEKYYFT